MDDSHKAAPTALSLEAVTKSFGANRALDRVSLAIMPGEIHALVGQNGSGKSTLVKLLAGYHQPDAGSVARVNGERFDLGSPKAAAAAGLRFVHQDLGLVHQLSIADNLALATGPAWLRPLRRRGERARARRALSALGYQLDGAALVGSLSEAERTAVAVARALEHGEDIRLLVLDEATAALPRAEANRLYDAVRAVARNGTAVLFVSHHLDEVMSVAHRVTVLRDGRHVETQAREQLTRDQVVEMMLGRKLTFDPRTADAGADEAATNGLVLSRLSGRIVRHLDLQVRPGEVLGVTGLTGSGREELAGLVAGRLPRAGGVHINGAKVPPGDPAASIKAGIGYVPADRAGQSLLPLASVRENLTLPATRQFGRRGRLRVGPERAEARHWIQALSVRPAETERSIAELSGGNQQKVVMARWLRLNLSALVLDEPTQGVDVGSKAEIHALVRQASEAGCAVLVCSNDAEELVQLATRVLVMVSGKKGVVLQRDELNVHRLEAEQLASGAASRPRSEAGVLS